MTIRKVAPYGRWNSPINADAVLASAKPIAAPRASSKSARAFVARGRSTVGTTLLEITRDGPADILPAEYSVSNAVYEYGGSLYDVCADDRLIFSNKDGGVYVLDPDTREVKLIHHNPVLRYCGFSASKSSPWVIAIQEDHTNSAAVDVRNYVVAINVETGDLKRVVEGSDFYFSPSFSFDGNEIAWLEWDRPKLLFDSSRLCRAKFSHDGTVSHVQLVANESETESAAEPRFGPDGALYFCSEVSSPFRELFRVPPGKTASERIQLDAMSNSEIGEVRLFEGSRTYAPLSDRHVIAGANTNGVSQVICIDVKDKTWKPIVDQQTICRVQFDALVRYDECSALVIGDGLNNLPSLHKVGIEESNNVQRLYASGIQTVDHTWFSQPVSVQFPSKGSPDRDIHAFLWLPKNPKFIAPEGTLPPLIVMTHGGPTGHSGCGLNLRIQYFTSRGYAYAALNYSGSTSYGRKFRQSLLGNWGIIDADDSAELVGHLTEAGIVRPGKAGITGLSAGGYNTLQSLVRHPTVFGGGLCASGISDLAGFDAKTHKLEYDYTPALCLPPGKHDISPEEKEKIYRSRSALFHQDSIQRPLLFIHGAEDTVVPLEQATKMAQEMREADKDVRLVIVDNDGHSLAEPKSVRIWLNEEEQWWSRTLL